MTKLWRAIEESPLLMDVKDVWRERLGKEFEPLSRFLEATNIVATRLPGRTPWSSLKVVENGTASWRSVKVPVNREMFAAPM